MVTRPSVAPPELERATTPQELFALLRPRRFLIRPASRIGRAAGPFLLGHPLGPEGARLRAALPVPIGGHVDGDAEEPGVEGRLSAE